MKDQPILSTAQGETDEALKKEGRTPAKSQMSNSSDSGIEEKSESLDVALSRQKGAGLVQPREKLRSESGVERSPVHVAVERRLGTAGAGGKAALSQSLSIEIFSDEEPELPFFTEDNSEKPSLPVGFLPRLAPSVEKIKKLSTPKSSLRSCIPRRVVVPPKRNIPLKPTITTGRVLAQQNAMKAPTVPIMVRSTRIGSGSAKAKCPSVPSTPVHARKHHTPVPTTPGDPKALRNRSLDVYGLSLGQGVTSTDLLQELFVAMGLKVEFSSKMRKNNINGQFYARVVFPECTDTLNVLLSKGKLARDPYYAKIKFCKPTE